MIEHRYFLIELNQDKRNKNKLNSAKKQEANYVGSSKRSKKKLQNHIDKTRITIFGHPKDKNNRQLTIEGWEFIKLNLTQNVNLLTDIEDIYQG